MRMKEILVKHHIGAIMVAVIGLQGLVGIGSLVLTPLLSLVLIVWNRVRKGPDFIPQEMPRFTAEVFVWSVIQSVLLLAISYGLALWLYSGDEPGSDTQPQS